MSSNSREVYPKIPPYRLLFISKNSMQLLNYPGANRGCGGKQHDDRCSHHERSIPTSEVCASFSFLLSCSDTSLDNFELAKLSEVANLLATPSSVG